MGVQAVLATVDVNGVAPSLEVTNDLVEVSEAAKDAVTLAVGGAGGLGGTASSTPSAPLGFLSMPSRLLVPPRVRRLGCCCCLMAWHLLSKLSVVPQQGVLSLVRRRLLQHQGAEALGPQQQHQLARWTRYPQQMLHPQQHKLARWTR